MDFAPDVHINNERKHRN